MKIGKAEFLQVDSGEKKVEYLELIYDLIFVYVIGRNNSLLDNVENGFVSGNAFLIYMLCALTIIQIWNFSTFYTNMFGRNRVRDHVFMFINMYLLYYMGEGIRVHWEGYLVQYHVAWAMILVNIGVQYLLELRDPANDANSKTAIKGHAVALLGEAVLVLVSGFLLSRISTVFDMIAILYGVIATWLFTDRYKKEIVDFRHLTERAMLYVVFTFGEMIIAVASYFEDGFDWSTVYFFSMCFLIVVGLFLSYEILYDHVIDMDMNTSGLGYMMIHLLLIFGLNHLSTSLEFMRNTGVELMPKTLLLISSFIMCFGCMLGLLRFARPELKKIRRILIPSLWISTAFIILMIVFREIMRVNIMLTVIYVFTMFSAIYIYNKAGGETGDSD